MPNAMAPSAPCVDVWLSPQAMVMPGWVSPSSGPMTCTMPWLSAPPSPGVTELDAELAAVPLERALSSPRRSRRGTAAVCELVGTMWSTVAKVRSGIRDTPPVLAQHVERLRARHLVNEVQADEQLRLTAWQRADGVRVPDFVEKCVHGNRQ